MMAAEVTEKLSLHNVRKRQWVIQSAGAEPTILCRNGELWFLCVLMSRRQVPKGTVRGEVLTPHINTPPMDQHDAHTSTVVFGPSVVIKCSI